MECCCAGVYDAVSGVTALAMTDISDWESYELEQQMKSSSRSMRDRS